MEDVKCIDSTEDKENVLMIKGKHLNETFYVKAHHKQYTFIISKMPKLSWAKHTNSKFMYFLYITRSPQDFVDKSKVQEYPNKVLCFHKVYFDYEELMNNMITILKGFLDDNVKLIKFITLCEQLKDPKVDSHFDLAAGE